MSGLHTDVTLSIDVTSYDCKYLVFTETTGTYNSVTNPHGWNNAYNIDTNTAASAVLTITTPSGTVYTFDLYSTFPTKTTTLQYLINYSAIGMSSGLVDGIYSFSYEVVGSYADARYVLTASKTTMITCNLQCCIDKLLSGIDWDCDCSQDAKDKFLTANTLYDQIVHTIECGDLDKAQELVDMANKICKNSNCSNCK